VTKRPSPERNRDFPPMVAGKVENHNEKARVDPAKIGTGKKEA